MHYIVFDLEWNQPVNADRLVKKPVVLHGEIIQIGAVKLNEEKQIADTISLLIKPKFYKKLHWSVAKLTRMKTADLEQGHSFPDGIRLFREFVGEDGVLCTWGPDDMGILLQNLRVHNLEEDWLPKHYDLQMFYDMELANINRQASLEEAMEFLEEEPFPPHDALNDALNTATVCKYLDFGQVFQNYEQRQKEYECRLAGADDIFHSTTGYPDKDRALEDAELLSFLCPKCGCRGALSGVIFQNGNKYLALGECQNQHGFLARFKMVRDEENKVRAVRYLYELTEERKDYYNQKRKLHEKKQKKYEAWQKRHHMKK